MTNTKTMREMMVAASLIAASGCGTVIAGDDRGEGAGSGSDEVVVAHCDGASDCGSGSACDIAAHECVTDVLTIDDGDFVDDGLRWWSATSGPVLRGKYEAGADAVVQVKVGAGAAMAATVDGTRWNVQLPGGTVTGADTLVTVTLTDPTRGAFVLEQSFALDSAAPVLGLATSTLRDERGDAIDFSSGVPVHDHQGAEIDLGASGCPRVHKYSYLMDTHAPAYGSEVAPNPITYAVTVQDTKLAAAEFRVRDLQGTVLRDWKPITGSGSSYPLTLYRDGDAGIGELATMAGTYTIDVRARDWGGLESSVSYCIDLQPLAAPLHVAQATTPNDADALPGWSLMANSPISRLATVSTGVAIAEQKITQYSSEPVVVSLTAGTITGTWRIQYLQGYIASSFARTLVSCTNYNCNGVPAATPTSLSGALSQHTKTLQLVDAGGNVVPSVGARWTIPGRAVGSPPAEYRVRVRLSNVAHYGSNSTFPYGEHTKDSLNYTGTPSSQTTSACAHVDGFNNCTSIATYQYIRGVNTIGLSLNTFEVGVAAAASATNQPIRPPHVPAATFVAPAINWDGGDENTF